MVGRGECTAQCVARSGGPLRGGKEVDCFLEAALQQLLVAMKGDLSTARQLRSRRQVEAMNRVEKEERANTIVEVLALAPEGIQRVALREQFVE